MAGCSGSSAVASGRCRLGGPPTADPDGTDWPAYCRDARNTEVASGPTPPPTDLTVQPVKAFLDTAASTPDSSNAFGAAELGECGPGAVGPETAYHVIGPGLSAFDRHDGTLRWWGEVGPVGGNTPVLVGDRLYVHAKDDSLRALDATTGRVRWSGGDIPSTFSPPPAVAADGTVIVGSDALPVLVGVRCGEQRWRVELAVVGFGVSGVTVTEWTVYVGTVASATRAELEDRYGIVDPAAHHSLVAVSTADGTVEWRGSAPEDHLSVPAVADGHVFVACADGHLYAVEAADGTLAWPVPVRATVSPPVVVDGTVYVESLDEHVHAFDAADGTRRDRVDVGRVLDRGLAVADGSSTSPRTARCRSSTPTWARCCRAFR